MNFCYQLVIRGFGCLYIAIFQHQKINLPENIFKKNAYAATDEWIKIKFSKNIKPTKKV